MPARIDSDKFPTTIIAGIYTAQFLAKIGQEFKFDGRDPEIASRIVRMGASYIALRRHETGNFEKSGSQSRKLISVIKSFRHALEKGEELDLAELMNFAARNAKIIPQKNRKPLGAAIAGDGYFHVLLQLLDILEAGLKENIVRSAPKRGPRVNFGLEVLTVQSAEFFRNELQGRPFTIDPHKPFKPTQAFDFIKALVAPLDSVTDDEIVTAIRAAKSSILKRNKPSRSQK